MDKHKSKPPVVQWLLHSMQVKHILFIFFLVRVSIKKCLCSFIDNADVMKKIIQNWVFLILGRVVREKSRSRSHI